MVKKSLHLDDRSIFLVGDEKNVANEAPLSSPKQCLYLSRLLLLLLLLPNYQRADATSVLFGNKLVYVNKKSDRLVERIENQTRRHHNKTTSKAAISYNSYCYCLVIKL